jgi:hypothetical protein
MICKYGIIALSLIFSLNCFGQTWDLTFTPDTGFRIENAAIPRIFYDSLDGKYFLYFDNSPGPGSKYEVSYDGINFYGSYFQLPPSVFSDTSFQHNPKINDLHAGISRNYWKYGASDTIVSNSSTDRITFSADTGFRYILMPNDSGRMGVNDFFKLSGDSVTFIYIGDLFGRNNTRLAVSDDNGISFQFVCNNIFSDYFAGGGGNTYVDVKSTYLDDGSVRIFTMKGGDKLYCFRTINGIDYIPEGNILKASDFSWTTLYSLNDPHCIKLPDGRYRIYVAARTEAGAPLYSIVSATSNYPTKLNENSDDQPEIKIYPNPFQDQFTLSCSEEINYAQIFDMSGKLLTTFSLNNSITTCVKSPDIKAGTYIIKISTKDRIWNKILFKTSN